MGSTQRQNLSGSFPERHNQQIAETDPETAYDMWAQVYDLQPGNLMLTLDEEIFSGLLQRVLLLNKTIVDIGCGTGRHWDKIMAHNPVLLSGYDVSMGMLDKLKEKYPEAEVFHLVDNNLPGVGNGSVDVIVSTLAVAHIENMEDALVEWRRVLKNNGDIIITDYHPAALSKGADRTFMLNGQKIAVKNYIHPIDEISATLKRLGFEILHLEQRCIDDAVRHYYEEKNALPIYNKFKDVPIIYGMHLKLCNATT